MSLQSDHASSRTMPLTTSPALSCHLVRCMLLHHSPVIVTTMRRPLARSRCSHNHSPANSAKFIVATEYHEGLPEFVHVLLRATGPVSIMQV
jgi:hypothetical protein